MVEVQHQMRAGVCRLEGEIPTHKRLQQRRTNRVPERKEKRGEAKSPSPPSQTNFHNFSISHPTKHCQKSLMDIGTAYMVVV